jgi:hypothetical protein
MTPCDGMNFAGIISVMMYLRLHKGAFALLIGCWMILGSAQIAHAIPTLQLDIVSPNTFYDPATETIATTSPNFTLYALLNPDRDSDVDGTYFISAAILGPIDSGGSFVFDGQEIAVNGEMAFGTPPMGGGKQLPPHGIFDTYYAEFPINFGEAFEAIPYNTQDDAGLGPISSEGTGFYALAFDIDVSDLGEDLSLHFDLYQTGSGIVEFAPFSHSAQFQRAPEPGTILLLGLGLTGLATWHRRRRSAGQ